MWVHQVSKYLALFCTDVRTKSPLRFTVQGAGSIGRPVGRSCVKCKSNGPENRVMRITEEIKYCQATMHEPYHAMLTVPY